MARPNVGFDIFTKNILDALGIDSSSSLRELKEANDILSQFAARGKGKNIMQRVRFTKGILGEMMEVSKFADKLRKFSESGGIPTRKSEGYLAQGFRSGTHGRAAFIRKEHAAWSQYLSHSAFIKSDEYLKGKTWELDRNLRRDTALQQLGLLTSGAENDFDYLREAEERSNREIDERHKYEREAERNHRLAESRGSIKNRRERLMLMREFPTFFRNSKMSTKDMRSMAVSLRAIRKIPILGKVVTNPIGAALAVLGAQKMAFNVSDAANKEVVDWQNQVLMTGGIPKEFENAGYLAGLKGPGEMMSLLGKLQESYGPAAVEIMRGYGSILASTPEEQRSMIASSLGLDTKSAAVAIALSNPELFQSDQRRTNAYKNKLDTMKTLGFSTGASFTDTAEAAYLSVMGGAGARDAANSRWVGDDVDRDYEDEMNRLVYQVDNIRDTAIADDQYSSGQFDTPTGDSYGGGNKNITVQMNVNADVNTDDPSAFIKELSEIGSRGVSDAEYIISNNDTKRTN